MNRLIHLLLAGTLVPALALTPLIPASAQTPDPRERHGQGQGQGQRPAGAERGPGGGGMPRQEPRQGGMQGQMRPPQGQPGGNLDRRQGNGEPRLPGGMNRANEIPRNRPPLPGPTPQRATQPDRVPQPDRAQAREDRKAKKALNGERDTGLRNDKPGRVDRPDAPPRLGDGERREVPSNDAIRNNPAVAPRIKNEDASKPLPRDTIRRDDNARRDKDQRDSDQRNPDRRNQDRRDNQPGGPRRVETDDNRNPPPRNDRRIGPGGIAIGVGAGVAAGVAGAFLAPTNARRLDDLRRDRQEVRTGDSTFIREPGRTIVEQGGRSFIVHDENERFRALGLAPRRERRGNTFIDTIDRPDGVRILTFTDITGRLLRRVRRTRDGREFVLIDNGDGGHIQRYADDIVVLPPPQLRIPRDRYIVDYRDADEGLLYDTLIAPPLQAPPRRYTLDQIRYSPDIRNYVRSVDINTINFDTGSWDVPAAATGQLRALASAIKRAIDRDPNSVFLVEGFTDATGNADDNLSLSDRRAQSVAEILTKSFAVPPENLTTQGYGEQNPKEDTKGPSAVNRRVVVQNITQLLASGGQPGPAQ